ncbi:hypothetical protein D9M71_441950 [compost metagenome]
MIDEGIEELGAGRLGQVLTTAVVDVVEQAVFVFQFEVIPILAAHEDSAVTVLQFKVMHAFEDLREGFALLEVLPVVICRAGGRFTAKTKGVGGVDELGVRPAYGPTGADGKGRIELTFDFADLEVDGMGTGARPKADGQGQQVRAHFDGHSGGGPLASGALMSCESHVLVTPLILLFWCTATQR